MPVIDQHDDLCESFLSAIAPSAVSEILKVSSWTESEDLLDRDFALIIVDEEGKEHRKFACSDPGNALMSEWYLLNAEHRLPEVAVKVAAANIATAMDSFGMSPTPATVYLADSSAGVDSRRVSFVVPFDDEKTADAMRGYPSKPAISTGMGTAMGAVSGAALGARSSGSPMHRLGRAAIGGVLGGGAVGGGTHLINQTAKVASRSAFDYIAEAEEQWDDLDPYDRHDVAVDLVKVASEVGATVPSYIYQYSGTSLSPMFEKFAQARVQFSSRVAVQEGYRRLSKMAGAMDPEDVIEALYLLDEQAQLNHRYGDRIPDPVLSVYGTVKEAEYSWAQGGDYVTERMLKQYSGSMRSNTMEDVFTEDLKDMFRRDPVNVFKRMPNEQKILVSRLASQSHESNNGGR